MKEMLKGHKSELNVKDHDIERLRKQIKELRMMNGCNSENKKAYHKPYDEFKIVEESNESDESEPERRSYTPNLKASTPLPRIIGGRIMIKPQISTEVKEKYMNNLSNYMENMQNTRFRNNSVNMKTLLSQSYNKSNNLNKELRNGSHAEMGALSLNINDIIKHSINQRLFSTGRLKNRKVKLKLLKSISCKTRFNNS